MRPNLNNFIPDPHAHGIEEGDPLPSVEGSTFRGEGRLYESGSEDGEEDEGEHT